MSGIWEVQGDKIVEVLITLLLMLTNSWKTYVTKIVIPSGLMEVITEQKWDHPYSKLE